MVLPPKKLFEIEKFLLPILLLIAIFLMTINPVAETFGDTGYEMKTGEIALRTLSVPKIDLFSFAVPLNQWIAHYWLAGVVFYLEYTLLGFWGLILGSSTAAALAYLFVFKTAKLYTESNVIPAALIIPISSLTYELWVARPQIFSYLFLAALIFLLEKWKAERSGKTIFFVPPLIALWANMHAGVSLGIAVIGVYLIEELTRDRNAKFLAIGAASITFSLLNPNTYRTLFYSSIISASAKEMNVLEWRSFLDFLERPQAKIFLGLMIITSLFVLYRILRGIRSRRDIPLARIALVAAAFFLPILSIRHVGFFPILLAPLVIGEISNSLNNKAAKLDNKRLVFLTAGFLLLFIVIFFLKDLKKAPIDELFLPAKAVDFLETHHLSDNMFNSPSYGGYLIHRLYPRHKIFIDGRSEVYAGIVNQEYLSVMRQSPGWQDIVYGKYNFNSFFLSYRDQNAPYTATLFRALTENGEFKLVYWDDAVIILAKNSPENRALIERFGYNLINPFTDPYSIPPALREKAAEELLRAIRVSPTSQVLRDYLRLQ